MKKFNIILALLLVFSLVSCQNDEPLVLDVNAAAERLVSELTFHEELFALDEEMARSLLMLDEAVEAEIAMYVGSGASADSVIVASGSIYDTVKAYLDSQEQMYASYMINEAAKIANAVTEQKNGYTIVVITADENAQSLVSEIIK